MAYDANTGNLKWTVPIEGNDFIQMGGASGIYAYGNIYVASYDGYITCVDVATGATEWKTLVETGGLELPEAGYPLSGCAVADNKVFTSSSKSYETEPLYRGHKLTCLDATTGEQLWNISGQMTSQTIAYGVLITTNNYDGGVYCFGKGPTSTTVTAPMTEVTEGSSVIIQGTVTDQTPEAKDTPAISDKDMTAWMEYLYMNKPRPTYPAGVDVSIDAVDPNNNFVHIATVTSDDAGAYSYAWETPKVPGKYMVIATFPGSKSYYSSYAETAMTVSAAPVTPPVEQPTAAPDNTLTIIAAAIAVIIAVAIVGLMLLRKKP